MASETQQGEPTVEGSAQQDSATAPSMETVSPKPISAHIGTARTEVPFLPATNYTAFQRPKVDPIAEGSKTLELALRLEGRLGYFWTREQGDVQPDYLNIIPLPFREAARNTILIALNRLIRLKGLIQDPYIIQRATIVADVLSDGLMIAAYYKLRSICGVDIQRMFRFCRKPKVPAQFELPTPFALAISQLGVVEVSSLALRRICIPSASEADCMTFLLPANRSWSLTIYGESVEFAKSVGLEFTAPDLHVKMGSSWWLHTRTAEVNFTSIDCCLPEDNFTESTAVLYSMFCHGTGTQFGTNLFNLNALGNQVYDRVITNPHEGIAVSSFFAITDDANAQLWKISG